MTQLELEAFKAGPARALPPVNDVVLSDDGVYRFLLTTPVQREKCGIASDPNRLTLDPPNADYLHFILFNPSTADAQKPDPTVTKCTGFARHHGFKGIRITNPYAFRTPYPKDLRKAFKAGTDIVCPEMNDRYIRWAMMNSAKTVVGWGKVGPIPARIGRIVALAQECAVELHAIGTNVSRDNLGQPKHPLMTAYTTPMTRWTPPDGDRS